MVRLFSFVDTDSDFWKGMKRDISFSFFVSLAIYIFLWNWIEWAMFDKCGQLCGLSKIGPKIANLVQTVGFELLVAVCERVMGGVGREGTGQQARRKWAWVRPNALLSRAERHICSAEREKGAHFCVFQSCTIARNTWIGRLGRVRLFEAVLSSSGGKNIVLSTLNTFVCKLTYLQSLKWYLPNMPNCFYNTFLLTQSVLCKVLELSECPACRWCAFSTVSLGSKGWDRSYHDIRTPTLKASGWSPTGRRNEKDLESHFSLWVNLNQVQKIYKDGDLPF